MEIEERIAITREDIATWFDLNRRGEDAKEPCFWSLYPIASHTAKVASTTNRTTENYHTADLEASVDELLLAMSTNKYTKVYGVRLRKDSKDGNTYSTFDNPYYQGHRAGLAGLPKQQKESNSFSNMALLTFMIDRMEKSNAESIAAHERIQAIQLQMVEKIGEKEKQIQEMRTDASISGLKEQMKAIEASKQNRMDDFLDRVTPMLEMAGERFIENGFSFHTPVTIQQDTQHAQQEAAQQGGNQQNDSNDPEMDEALNSFRSTAKRPDNIAFMERLFIAINLVPKEERVEFDKAMNALIQNAAARAKNNSQ